MDKVTIDDLLTEDDVKQVLHDFSKEANDLEEVIVISFTKNSTICWQTTRMSNERFIYLLERVKHWALHIQDNEEQIETKNV